MMMTQECPKPKEPPQLPVDPVERDAALAELAKAFGHPARVAILRLLVHREGCIVGDLVNDLPLAQSTISQHLKTLKKAGLIRGEIDGPRISYCVEPGRVALFKALVEALLCAATVRSRGGSRRAAAPAADTLRRLRPDRPTLSKNGYGRSALDFGLGTAALLC